MKDVIIDTLLDAILIIPFLFIAFLIIELIEHKLSDKSKKIIEKSDSLGPLLGGALGIIPQCGFSVLATNLYITRIISLGTLISIYLSTSDEMLPILITEKVNINIIIKILLIKFLIGIICGFIIDFIIRHRTKKKKKDKKRVDYSICHDENCNCEDESVIVAALHHTIKTIVFIVLISFILNIIMKYLGNDYISKIFMKNNFFSPFIASLIGLIPNCSASIILTELYINNAISFSSIISGLLSSSGVALLVLFRSNHNLKENLFILFVLYMISVFSGLIIEIIELL